MRAFLSHSSGDKPLATAIYRTLRDQAVSVWFDRIELRPGDSLITRIAEGITDSDYLIILVTENSKRSPWVQKELSIALTQEIQGTGPKVIPLLLEGSEIPTILADKYYISIDSKGAGSQEIVPAIFRNSYIVDVALTSDDLSCDQDALRDELYEWMRADNTDIKIRIDTRNFNHKVISIAEQATSLSDIPPAVANQIRRVSESFALDLPIYWVNLSELLSRLISTLFDHYGKNLDAVKTAVTSCRRAMEFAQLELYSRIRPAIFAVHAEQFECPDIAKFIHRFSDIERHEEEKFVTKICEVASNYSLAYVGLEGVRARRIRDAKIHLPTSSSKDRVMLQVTCPPSEIVPDFAWFLYCLPQIVGNFLQWTSFREGRPLHELDYNIGLALSDYERVGFA